MNFIINNLSNNFISKHNLKGTYLDVACGFGRITSAVSPLFKYAYAMDASPLMIKKIKKNCPDVTVIQMDAEKIKFNSNKFDLITTIRFIMSFDNNIRIKILKEINRVLKTEGVFICSVHLNKWSPRGILSQFGNKFQNLGQPCMSYSEIKKELKIAGFDILDFHGVKIFPFYGKKLLFPKELLLNVENILGNLFPFKYFADGYIFVCKKKVAK